MKFLPDVLRLLFLPSFFPLCRSEVCLVEGDDSCNDLDIFVVEAKLHPAPNRSMLTKEWLEYMYTSKVSNYTEVLVIKPEVGCEVGCVVEKNETGETKQYYEGWEDIYQLPGT